MDKYLKVLLEILSRNNIVVYIRDPEILNDIQKQAAQHDIRIMSKRIPYEYVTKAGYIWQHQNSRTYELSV